MQWRNFSKCLHRFYVLGVFEVFMYTIHWSHNICGEMHWPEEASLGSSNKQHPNLSG